MGLAINTAYFCTVRNSTKKISQKEVGRYLAGYWSKTLPWFC